VGSDSRKKLTEPARWLPLALSELFPGGFKELARLGEGREAHDQGIAFDRVAVPGEVIHGGIV
jgi:hypothetical protein